MALERRSKGNVEVEIKFDGKTPFRTKKELFLANQKNKQTIFHQYAEESFNRRVVMLYMHKVMLILS